MPDIITRKKYATDVTDEQWAIIEPIVTGASCENRLGRHRTVSLRDVLNTIFYINRTGCQWDLLPHVRIRWVVERSNAWHSRCRRNSKDYERRPDSSESMIKISHIGVMLRRCSPTKSPNFNYRDADV